MPNYMCECRHSDERCPVCCDHGDIDTDERCCLDCGSDMTERLMSGAEAYYEGDR